MIELTGLTKRYGKVVAVDDLSLSIAAGEVFGFLGPNGAGKTTTIRMMMGLVQPTAGQIRLGGFDLGTEDLAAKGLCGFVPDRPHIYEKLTGAEFLDFVAGLYGVAPAEARELLTQLLAMFDLTEWAHELVETYSHGMKQRTVMAAALIHAPRLLVLDEPLVGMDPRGARLLKHTLRELSRTGVTVFVSTHSLGLAEELCDRIGIIVGGRLQAVGSLAELGALASLPRDTPLEDIFLKLTIHRSDDRSRGRLPLEEPSHILVEDG
jgi:ABC-2 type transport system ATP-binding protein